MAYQQSAENDRAITPVVKMEEVEETGIKHETGGGDISEEEKKGEEMVEMAEKDTTEATAAIAAANEKAASTLSALAAANAFLVAANNSLAAADAALARKTNALAKIKETLTYAVPRSFYRPVPAPTLPGPGPATAIDLEAATPDEVPVIMATIAMYYIEALQENL